MKFLRIDKVLKIINVEYLVLYGELKPGSASIDSQQHCIDSMQRQIAQLIQQGIIEQADPQALACLIYGSLAETAFWIADGDDHNQRLKSGRTALNLLLRGLLIRVC
ncbi:hypothetical protein [Acinetobacter guillouiae]|uniref:hypothetical protein n=1 Tax=Acinetobacter guillouiae TaxID=106649 RepID=UPI002FDB2F70